MTERRYTWRRDLPDHRDHWHDARTTDPLPPAVDLRPHCPPVYDQGRIGSCTANAIAAAFEFDLRYQGLPEFVPSRLFVYYNERAREGTTRTDAGAMIRDGIKTVHQAGVCPEREWPYDDTPARADGTWPRTARAATKPPPACYTDALKARATSYARVVQTGAGIKAALAAGRPVVFGFTVYESFEADEVARTGVVSMPGPDESALGGHAVVAVGYDDTTQRFLCRNSWGVGFGQAGYFTMPYEYLTDRQLAADFWVIRAVT